MSALLRVSFNWNLKILGLAVLELPKSALNRQGIAFDSGGKIYSLRNLKISPFTIELLDNFFFKIFFSQNKIFEKKIWTKKIFLIIFWSKSWFLLKNGCAENCFQTWNTIFEVAKKISPKCFFTQTNNLDSFFEKRARTSVGLVVESRESRPKVDSRGFPRPVPHFSARSFSKKEKRKKVSLLYQNVGCSKWSLDFCSSPTIGFTSLSGMVK